MPACGRCTTTPAATSRRSRATTCSTSTRPRASAPLLSVFGGKITTYRRLAEHALDQLRRVLRFRAAPGPARATLPGGDLPGADFERFLGGAAVRAARGCRRRSRGATRGPMAPGSARCWTAPRGLDDLGEPLGDGLYEAEVDYLVPQRVGADRGGHPVPPLQARPARRRCDRGAAGRLARAHNRARRPARSGLSRRRPASHGLAQRCAAR